MFSGLLAAILMVSPAATNEGSDSMPNPRGSPISIEELISRIRIVAQQNGKAVRLYYRAESCGRHPVQYPPLGIMASPFPQQEGAVASVGSLFADGTAVEVDDDSSNIVRIIVGNPSFALLGTRIHSLNYSESARFSPLISLLEIRDNPDVIRGMQLQSMHARPTVYSIYAPTPSPNLPSLPASTGDITFDEGLDQIATTFRGIITYAACPDGREFRIRFTSIFNQ